ncbi:MAG: dipeptidase [Ignavibacteriae bacterium HGW-Ignavibacteriae-1]|jgi:acetylornithine deacetylase/succinyl-diaminopimelate desuccinylase-like protein|nr:MAG: dipeptidase [Ignavibacteriae bacterium HGW-Ignavibacteriae-1]
MSDYIQFIESNKDRFFSELVEFLKIPSVSSQTEHNQDTRKAADWLVTQLNDIGMPRVELYETAGHPVVYAEDLRAGADAKTVLIYGHYDVQPVDPIELWNSPPFEPVVNNGKIYARGSSDDKGQVFAHIKAVEAYQKTNGCLPVNIKFMIEGEEECGSNNLDVFIRQHKDMLKCDTVMVSDTEWFAEGLPSICYSLRGLSYIEITVTGPNRDLHSGTYGGAVDNPLNVLCDIVSSLKDKYGRITIPGFYDDVKPLTSEEREGFAKLPFNYEEYTEELGVAEGNGEFGFTTLERTWARPTLDLNGIYGGYTGEGAKTILPSKASAKISMRLVPYQNHEDITAKITNHLKSITPPTVKLDITPLHGGNPVMIELESDGLNAAKRAMNRAFGKDPIMMREGGSIPIVEMFGSELKAPTILMGIGLPSDNIHSPNESFSIDNFFGGIKASAIFLEEFAK